jgi:hypothetical protein
MPKIAGSAPHYRPAVKSAEYHDNRVPNAAIMGCRMEKFSSTESGKITRSCGPDCTCIDNKGMSMKAKTILFFIIIVFAGAVLTNSIIRKARRSQAPANGTYASAICANAGQSIKKESLPSADSQKTGISITKLPSLSFLDDLAKVYDGAFILLLKDEPEKNRLMTNEVNGAMNAIGLQGVRMCAFQLEGGTQDFNMINSQLPAPSVLVIMKGKGMRGVAGGDIAQPKLLQACLAAMLPPGCGPGSCRAGSSSCTK